MKYLTLLLLVIACAACDSSTSGSTSASVLEGYVQLYDSLGQKLADHSGAKVSILGGSQSTTTSTDGQWNLAGFPVNTPMTLVFTKAGYAEERYDFTAVPTPGGNVAFGLKRMYAIQTFDPSLVLRAFDDIFNGSEPVPSYKAIFSVRIPEFDVTQTTAYCMIFFSKTNAISSSNPSSYEYSTPLRQTTNDGAAYFDIYADSLYAHGFPKAGKIYCKGYAGGFHCGTSFYVDPVSSKAIYTGFSPIPPPSKNFIAP